MNYILLRIFFKLKKIYLIQSQIENYKIPQKIILRKQKYSIVKILILIIEKKILEKKIR